MGMQHEGRESERKRERRKVDQLQPLLLGNEEKVQQGICQ